jgi:hypothetical protein
MKKLLVAFAALGLAVTANAGDYHKKDTLRCSQCHTMHGSRSHGFNAATGDALPAAYAGPYRKLLVANGTNETCLACHDNAGEAAPDVLGGDSSTTFAPANHRSAGFLNGVVGSHSGGANDWSGHTIGSATAPPGFVGIYEPTPVENFNCANCHAVHGSGAYRNLGLSSYMGLEGMAFDATNPFTKVGPTYNAQPTVGARVTTFDATKDVTIGVDGRNYDTVNVKFGQGADSATTTKNGMNAYCAVCHGNFHGDANTRDQVGGLDFVRHPTSAVVRVNAGATLFGNVTMNSWDLVRPVWTAAPGATTDFEAACLSCHKGHGNANGYGLIYPAVGAFGPVANTNYENGDALPATYPIRNLCITCHPMGRY